MGLFDIFKRKQVSYSRIRKMEMKFMYKCFLCSREEEMFYETPIVEEDKHLYTAWVGQSGSPNLEEIPVIVIRVDEKESYTVEDIFYNLGNGKTLPASSERLDRTGLIIECAHCGGKNHFIIGTALVQGEQGQVLLVKDTETSEAYDLPVVLLSDDRQGNFNVVTFLNPTPEPAKDTEMVELDLESAEDYNKRGVDYYFKQQYNLAIADFNKAIELDPSFSGAYHNRGLAFRDGGQYALAILDFNKAIELNPSTIAYFNRGLAYSDIGLYDLSIADFSKAIELDHNFARAYYERACAYYNKGNYDLDLADLNRVVEISTDDNLTELARQAIRNLKGK